MKSRDILLLYNKLTKKWDAPEDSRISYIMISPKDIVIKEKNIFKITLDVVIGNTGELFYRITYILNDKNQWRFDNSLGNYRKTDSTIITKFFKEHVDPIMEKIYEDKRSDKKEEK